MLTFYKTIEKIWFTLPQKLRYLLVGGFNTVMVYILFAAIVCWGKLSYQTAIILVHVVGVNVSIFTMRYYVFHSFGNLKREYVRAWSVYFVAMLINYAAMFVMVDVCAVNELAAQAVYTVCITILTYILHKYFSFSK